MTNLSGSQCKEVETSEPFSCFGEPTVVGLKSWTESLRYTKRNDGQIQGNSHHSHLRLNANRTKMLLTIVKLFLLSFLAHSEVSALSATKVNVFPPVWGEFWTERRRCFIHTRIQLTRSWTQINVEIRSIIVGSSGLYLKVAWQEMWFRESKE